MAVIEKIKAKAKRLFALAERGIGGEKENATRMLKDLMDKHKIDISDIDENNNQRSFRIKDKDDFLILTNVIVSVNPYSKVVQKGQSVHCELDNEDFKEVKKKYAYFIKLFRVELDLLVLTFFTKHQTHFRPDEHAEKKFRDGTKQKNEDVQMNEKENEKMKKKTELAINTPPPKEFNQGDLNRQKIERMNLNRMQKFLAIMLTATYRKGE